MGAAYQRVVGFQRDFGHTFWIIEERDSGAILGFCGIKRVNAPGAGDLTGKHEIGWRVVPESWARASPRKRRSRAWTWRSIASTRRR